MKNQARTLVPAVLFAICLTVLAVDAQAGYRYLNVGERIQEHSQWCWAGTSQCVLNYRSKTPSQCAIANYAWSRTDCCGNSTFNWNHRCNQPNGMYGSSGTIQYILSYWGVSSYGSATYLTWSGLNTEVNGNRPFVMRFGWSSGGGHFLVGYGYDDRSGTQRMGYMDPWPGEGYTWSNYSWVVRASDHSWTHTLRLR